MIIQTLQLAIVAWLPGAIVFRAPVANRAKRAALDPDERLFWAVIISTAISLSAVLALAYLGRYTLTRLLIVDVAAAAIIALASRFDLRLHAERRVPSASALLPLLLVLLGLWRFFPPAEMVAGGRDPGVYVNEGIQIAQRGTFVYEDPLILAVPPFARDLFFRPSGRPDYYGLRFMGFPLLDVDRGTVVGQFPHLFPASIAIGYGIDGLTGARRTPGAWAILGLLSVYFVGARVFGKLAAFSGAGLLALHLVQVWFARYPNAEVTMQALVFAALLATARAHVDDDGFFAPVGGYLLGLLLFLRVDAALAIAGVAGGLALLVMSGGRVRTSFVVPLVGVAVAALAYLTGPLWPHFERFYVFAHYLRAWQYAALVFGAACALAAIALASRYETIQSRVGTLAPAALTAALIIGAVYALYFRHPAGRLAAQDAYALRTFAAYYLTLPALIAALIGYALAARRAFWRAPELFTTVAVYAFFTFYKIHVVPEHFWMSRRFLPVILPAALLFAAAAALGTRDGGSILRPLRWTIGVAFLVLLGREYARRAEPILHHVEYVGLIPKLERIVSSIRETDLLIVESGDAGTDVHILAIPLANIYARNVLVFTSPAPDKAAFAAFLEWAAARDTRVLFLGAGGTDLLSPAWGARVISSDRFRVSEYTADKNAYPRHPRAKQFAYTIYEFATPVSNPPADGIDIDLGTEDDLNVLRFHAKEESEGRTFRWSQDESFVILPRLKDTSRTLTIWMSDGGRPDAAPPADLAVSIDDQALGTARVDTGFKPYTFQLPPALAARVAARKTPVRVKLSTGVWNPEAMLGTPDDRELGVMVDRVTVK